MKFHKLELLLPILVLVATLFTWRHIVTLQFVGEGYQYFAPWTYGLSTRTVYSHDVFAQIASIVTIPIFASNTSYYMIFSVIVMLISDLLFYFLMRVIVNNRVIAFLSAMLFGISVAGKYDMFSNGGYQYFLQRASLLPILLLSFIFLHLFLTKSHKKYLIISVFLYVFAVLMGFFATWFLPFSFFYPLVFLIANRVHISRALLKYLSPFIFLASNYLIISSSQFVSDRSFLTFIFEDRNFIPGIIHQLTVMTLPISKFNQASLLCLLIYLFGFIYIFRYNRRLFWISLALFFGTLGSLSFNVFLNFSAVSGTFDSSRYFYYPFLGVASFWGILLGSLLAKRRIVLTRILVIIFVMLIFLSNYALRNKLLAELSWNHAANKRALEIIKSWSRELKKNPSYVYMPTSIGPYGTTFAYQFFSHPDGQFFEERLHPVDFEELYNLHVDPNVLYVMHYEPITQTVIDKTEESRAKLSAIYASRSPNF